MAGNGIVERNDRFGTAFVKPDGTSTGVYTRCPHCGMVDHRHMNQGINQSHFCNYTVGGVSKYQCGKCRGFFKTLRIQVPEGVDPMALYEVINSLPDYALCGAEAKGESE